MDTIRTPEQRQADEAVYNAVRNCLEAYGSLDDFVVSDFVVLIATQKISDEGVVVTGHPILFKDGDIPWYKAIGLIETHRVLAHHQIANVADNG